MRTRALGSAVARAGRGGSARGRRLHGCATVRRARGLLGEQFCVRTKRRERLGKMSCGGAARWVGPGHGGWTGDCAPPAQRAARARLGRTGQLGPRAPPLLAPLAAHHALAQPSSRGSAYLCPHATWPRLLARTAPDRAPSAARAPWKPSRHACCRPDRRHASCRPVRPAACSRRCSPARPRLGLCAAMAQQQPRRELASPSVVVAM